jgi:hypothetical protein
VQPLFLEGERIEQPVLMGFASLMPMYIANFAVSVSIWCVRLCVDVVTIGGMLAT